jgi:hypothetical protein
MWKGWVKVVFGRGVCYVVFNRIEEKRGLEGGSESGRASG